MNIQVLVCMGGSTYNRDYNAYITGQQNELQDWQAAGGQGSLGGSIWEDCLEETMF